MENSLDSSDLMGNYAFRGKAPKVASTCFVAPSADIIGDVEISEGSSVWFNATIRGDINAIKIGKNVSIQDNCVLHTEKECAVEIGDDVVIGHQAIIHSAKIGSGTMIGMGAIILSGASIGKNCLVAAGSVVTEGTFIKDGSVVMGVPGKAVKQTTPVHQERVMTNVKEYSKLNEAYLKEKGFKRTE